MENDYWTVFSAAVIVAVFVLAATYSGCDLTLVGISFIVAVGALGIISASLILNPMDLSTNYAGTLSGIMGTFGCLMGVVVPIAVSQMTPNVSYTYNYILWYSPLNLVIIPGITIRMASGLLGDSRIPNSSTSDICVFWLRESSNMGQPKRAGIGYEKRQNFYDGNES